MLWLILVVVAISLAAALFVLHRSRDGKSPPGPLSLPLIGSLWLISPNDLHLQFARLARQYNSDVVMVRLGSVNFAAVHGADAIEEVFLHQGNQVLGRFAPALIVKLAAGNLPGANASAVGGVVFSEGEIWKGNRKLLVHRLLTKERVQKFFDVVEAEVDGLMEMLDEACKSGRAVDPNDVFTQLMTSIISLMSFGVSATNFSARDKRSDRDRRCADAENRVISYLESGALLKKLGPLATLLPDREFDDACRSADVVRSIMQEILVERKAHLEHPEKQELEKDESRTTLLDAMLVERSANEELSYLSDEQIVSVMVNLIFAASGTLGATMAWSLVEISRRDGCLEAIVSEIDRELGPFNSVSYDHIPKLEYLDALVNEVWRFHTPAPLAVFHRTLEPITVGKFTIPENTVIVPNLHDLHRRSEFWGPDFNDFKPSRWLQKGQDDATKRQLLRHFLPFGLGPRVCVGRNMATLISRYVLARIFQKHTFKFMADTDPNAIHDVTRLTTGPSSFKVSVCRR